MSQDFSRVSFAHLKQSDMEAIEAASVHPIKRELIAKHLRSFLLQWNNMRYVDEDRLYVLGTQIRLVWPANAKQELLARLANGVSDRVMLPFVNGFDSTKERGSLYNVRTPKKQEFDSLLAEVEVSPINQIRPKIEQIMERYFVSSQNYGNSYLFLKATEDLLVSLLRNPDAIAGARIASGLARRAIEVNDRVARLWIEWAKALAVEGATKASELVLWEASRLHPGRPSIPVRLSYLISTEPRRLEEAIALARQTVEMFPGYAGAGIVLSRLLARKGGEREALDILIRIINEQVDNHYAITLLAKIMVRSSKDLTRTEISDLIRSLPKNPRALSRIGAQLNALAPGGGLAEGVLRAALAHFPDHTHIPNQLASVLVMQKAAVGIRDAIAILRAARLRHPEDVYTLNHLAETLALTGDSDALEEAIGILRDLVSTGEGNDFTDKLLAALAAPGTMLPVPQRIVTENEENEENEEAAFASYERREAGDLACIPEAVAQEGMLRYVRFLLEANITNPEIDTQAVLRKLLAAKEPPEYARVLAIRHGYWEGTGDSLNSFAAAFELALKEEDVDRLRQLSQQYPRLDALILLARALFGDADAAQHIAAALVKPLRELHPAVATLRHLLPGFGISNDDSAILVAVQQQKRRIRAALHNVTDMIVEEQSVAA